MSFIIFEFEKKKQHEKKNRFFFHSFDIPPKCTKMIFYGEIKKYDTFVQTLLVAVSMKIVQNGLVHTLRRSSV